MTLIPLEVDKQTISFRFRKANFFAFIEENKKSIEPFTLHQNHHKTSKSPQFFEFFNTLNITKIFIKALGYKTFLKLFELNVKVYLITDAINLEQIEEDKLILLTKENAKEYCTLGHHNRVSS